ncbi:15871_t:CDS:1, partial [Funneliformis geosporum]
MPLAKSAEQVGKVEYEKLINRSGKAKQSTLEETIHKILQSELKLIFPILISQDSVSSSNKANTSKQVPSIQKKTEFQSDK